MPWLIQTLTYRPTAYYKWRVHGVNTETAQPEPFRWEVPNLSERFQLHPDASPEVRALFNAHLEGASHGN